MSGSIGILRQQPPYDVASSDRLAEKTVKVQLKERGANTLSYRAAIKQP